MSQEQKPRGVSRGLPDEALERLREALEDFWLAGRGVFPATIFFAIIIVIATAGYITLGWPPVDAFYMVMITVFTVGYGETQPVDTVAEKVWTIVVILGGWSAVVVTLGGLTKTITEGELRRASQTIRKTRVMEHLHDHIIICGYGRVGQTLARELHDAGVPFVIIDRDEERIAQINVDGYLGHRGDATDEGVLEFCGIRRARILATVLPQDALNVFITLTARDLSSEIVIIARGEQPSTEKKLMQAGANQVVLPATIGGLRIAHSILQPEVSQLLHENSSGTDLHALGLEVDELVLHQESHLVGKTVDDINRMSYGDVIIIGVRREQVVIRDALDSLTLEPGDALVAIARSKYLPVILDRDVDRTTLT